jgi:hypothetical protein
MILSIQTCCRVVGGATFDKDCLQLCRYNVTNAEVGRAHALVDTQLPRTDELGTGLQVFSENERVGILCVGHVRRTSVL